MRSFLAVRALWFAIVAPWRLKESTTGAAAATFALAVLLGAFVSSGVAMVENGNQNLANEWTRYRARVGAATIEGQEAPPKDAIPLDSSGRIFTKLLGENLPIWILGILLSAGAYMLLARFLTNESYTYSMALVCVSAASSIGILGTILNSSVHLATDSMRFGWHAGIFVDPFTSPFLHLWLQRVDVFDIWRAIAIGVGLTTWVGLDRRYGYVVGGVVWLTVFLVFFGIGTVISWILAQKATS